jgi:nucleotide-binding universal stress UspA family protein
MTGQTPSVSGAIVVGVNTSAASEAAMRWAAAQAARRHARLHAVHVVEHGIPGSTPPDRDLQLELQTARLNVPGRVGGWMFRAGIDVDVAVSVVTGSVADQLAREAGDASLVVIGTPDSLHHSALPADLAYGCLCPVAMVGTFGDVTYVDVIGQPSTKGTRHART